MTKYASAPPGTSWYFSMLDTGRVRFAVEQDINGDIVRYRYRSPRSSRSEAWQHVAATFDLATQAIRIYVNGTQVATTGSPAATAITGIYDSTTPVEIGAVRAGQFAWDGLIDDLRSTIVPLLPPKFNQSTPLVVPAKQRSRQHRQWCSDRLWRLPETPSAEPLPARNIIGGNTSYGVVLTGSALRVISSKATISARMRRNNDHSNLLSGVQIDNSASNNTIGTGPIPGSRSSPAPPGRRGPNHYPAPGGDPYVAYESGSSALMPSTV